MPVNFPEIVSGLQFRQRAMKKEQDGLLQQNIEALELRQDISGAEVKRRYSALVSKDKENIEAFNRAIKQHNPVIEGEFPIMTNKLNLILAGMDPLDEDGSIVTIYDNNISASYQLPRIGNNEFWGSSQSTFYTATLLYRLSAITETPCVQLMPITSSIFHVAPFTEKLLSCLGTELLTDKSYIFTEGKHTGFGFIHSGFAFGGSRQQQGFYREYLPNMEVKYFPEDCSSWIANVFQQTYSSSTADLLCCYRLSLSNNTCYVPSGWKEQPMAIELREKFRAIDPTKEQIKQGDIYFGRIFNQSATLETSLGVSGHVGLVFSEPRENSLESIEFTRDMPHIEGFGTRTVALNNSAVKSSDGSSSQQITTIHYLRPKF